MPALENVSVPKVHRCDKVLPLCKSAKHSDIIPCCSFAVFQLKTTLQLGVENMNIYIYIPGDIHLPARKQTNKKPTKKQTGKIGLTKFVFSRIEAIHGRTVTHIQPGLFPANPCSPMVESN